MAYFSPLHLFQSVNKFVQDLINIHYTFFNVYFFVLFIYLLLNSNRLPIILYSEKNATNILPYALITNLRDRKFIWILFYYFIFKLKIIQFAIHN